MYGVNTKLINNYKRSHNYFDFKGRNIEKLMIGFKWSMWGNDDWRFDDYVMREYRNYCRRK